MKALLLLPFLILFCEAEDFTSILKKHPRVQALKSQLNALEIQTKNTGLLPEPALNLGYGLKKLATRNGDMKAKIGLSQMLPSRLRRGFEKAAVTAQGQVIEAEIEILGRKLLTQALLAWLELSYLEQSQDLAREDLKHLDFAESTVSAHYQHHDYSLASILRLQSQREEVSTRLENLKRETAPARARLKNIFLNHPVPMVAIPKNLPESHESGNLSDHPQNLWFQARLKLEESRENMAHTAHHPDFMLGMEYSFIDPVNSAPRQGEDTFYLGFGLNLKLDSARYRSQKDLARTNLKTVKEKLNVWKLDQETREVELETTFRNSQASAKSLNQFIIPNLRKALESMRLNYSSNTSKNASEIVEIVRELLVARQRALLAWKLQWQALIQFTDLYDQTPPFSL